MFRRAFVRDSDNGCVKSLRLLLLRRMARRHGGIEINVELDNRTLVEVMSTQRTRGLNHPMKASVTKRLMN